MNADPFREMAAAMRGRTGFDGTMLKFSKGQWLAGKNAETMNGAELIAHVDQSMLGWCKWENKKPVDYHVGFVRDRFAPPKRSTLGESDPKDWERRDTDPWQFTFFLPLTDRDGQLYVYSTTSRGGKDVLANLQEAFADNRQYHPEDAHKLPLVRLSADHYPHPEFGRLETPQFDILRWVEPPPKAAKLIRPPASASPVLAIAHVPQQQSNEHRGDMDDEIPF
jgi:hypothetical protein